MSMSITVSSLAKELIGTDLINMGFPQQGMYFKGYSYIGKKDKVTINVESEISIEFLDALDQIALKHNEKGVVTQARQLKSLILDPDTVTVKTLKGFASGLASYILRGIKNGWLYKLASNDYYIAYMVDDIVFKRAVDRDDVSITTVSLMCHSAKDEAKRSLRSLRKKPVYLKKEMNLERHMMSPFCFIAITRADMENNFDASMISKRK